MNEKQEKLIKLLEDMFQLNQTDLDFGIYRIMNQKADEIKQFLQKDLIASIKNAFSVNSNDGLQKELNDLISTITNAGMNPEDSPKVKEIREKLSSSSNNESTENEIYSYLTNFFSRYYKDGDFVSLRRYKKDTYAIPYEGEEVKLHWANSDQYYIKTSEFFRDYTFKVENKTYHFKIVEADTEKNNNKASDDNERRFVLDYDYPIYEENGELFIRFQYITYKSKNDKSKDKVSKQEFLNKEAISIILAQEDNLINLLKELKPTTNNKERTTLEKHLTDYTSRNSFDYFIHKDLKEFLSRELDFFIKNEILYIDDILDISSSQIENILNKVKTFKTIANKIIAFLSQIEEFQKKLWLKKKFVIDANYCITLDRIDEKYYDEILNNGEQLKEWKILFNVEVKNIEDLEKEKSLVLDTKFFDSNFKDKLLSEFDDIDEECDGVLINSENFGALNLLQERYKEQVKTVYIDPPYNTGNDGFLYNDSYQHSSWMSFMFDRLNLSRNLMKEEGIIFSQIDEKEQLNLRMLKNAIFKEENFINTIAIKSSTPSGTKTAHKNKTIIKTKDYINVYKKNNDIELEPQYVSREKWDNHYSLYLEKINGEYTFFKLIDKLAEAGYQYNKLEDINPQDESIRKFIVENQEKIIRLQSHKNKELDLISREQYPDKVYEHIVDNELRGLYFNGQVVTQIKQGIKEIIVNKKLKPYWSILLCDFWNDLDFQNTQNEGIVSFPNGKKPEALIYRLINLSNNPQIVMDYFAGSGTTPAVAHKLNKKYIAIEMGEYFDKLTLKRMKYTLFGNSGGITSQKNGGMFKYFRLESYEDCLNNLAFKNTNRGLFDDNVKEDYLLNYMLDYETNESLLNIDAFKTPFCYKLKIATSSAGETVETNVDLVETFNYLIGLKVKTRVMNKGFLVIQGENLKEEKILVIWRDAKSNDELNAFFSKMDFTVYDREFDIIYVNGDNNLANLKKDQEHFKVKLIEEEFKARMFGE